VETLRLGLVLPPLREQAGNRPDGALSVAEVALAAEAAGIGAVWLPEGPPGCFDPVPLLGSLAMTTSTLGLGLLARPSHGRHPSILVRDVTALDLLSGGRAILGLLEEGTGPLDVERLAEAASLTRRLLSEEEVTESGRFYEVAELTTRPRPARAGGPKVAAGFAARLPPGAPSGEEAVTAAGVDAYLVVGSPEEVATSRGRLDGLAPAGAPPALLWHGGCPVDAATLDEVLDAGADGVLLHLDAPEAGGWPARASLDAALADLARLVRRLA